MIMKHKEKENCNANGNIGNGISGSTFDIEDMSGGQIR